MKGKHKAFADEYLITRNASESAIKVGYSRNGSAQIGFKLLRRADISEYLKAKEAELAKKSLLDAKAIKENLANIALNAPKDSDKVAALRLLGLDQGLFKENNIQTVQLFTQLNQAQQVTKDSTS